MVVAIMPSVLAFLNIINFKFNLNINTINSKN